MVRPAPAEIWNEYLQTRSIELRNRLVLHYTSLVNFVVRSFEKTRGFQADEFRSHAFLALISAIERVEAKADEAPNPTKYLAARIRGGIIDEIRRENPGTRGYLRTSRIWSEAARQLRAERGFEPSDEEVEQRLGISQGEWSRHVALGRRTRVDLDVAFGELLDEGGTKAVDDLDECEAVLATPTLSDLERETLNQHYRGNVNLSEIGIAHGRSPCGMSVTGKSARQKAREHMLAS